MILKFTILNNFNMNKYKLDNKYKLNNQKKLDEINITSYNFNAYEIKNKNILCTFAYLLKI
jgi:hypothetical protein